MNSLFSSSQNFYFNYHIFHHKNESILLHPQPARQWRVMTGWVGVINNCVRCGETSQRSSYNCNTSVSYDSIVWIIINTFNLCIIPSDSKICFFMPINENIMIEWSKYTRIKYVNTVWRSSFRNLYDISIPPLWMPATLPS